MKKLTVTALGTGDAFSAQRYSSCLLLETEATRVLVDCPHPIRKILKESTGGRVDVLDIDAVVVTHLHADHASGLEGFIWFTHFVRSLVSTPASTSADAPAGAHGKAKVIAHPAVLRGLWPMLAPSMSELLVVDDDNRPAHREHLEAHDLIDAVPLDDDGVVVGDLHLRPRITVHHIPTTALQVSAVGTAGSSSPSSPSSSSPSPSSLLLGYSADTAFDPALIAWLDEAPRIIHETNFGAHTPYEKLAALPSSLRAKMSLIHWSDFFDVDASVIPVLKDGDSFTVDIPD